MLSVLKKCSSIRVFRKTLFAGFALFSLLVPGFGQVDPIYPSISVEPESQTAPAGSSIALSVTAAGSDPLNYQWWNSAGPIQDATNAIFTLTSADPTNSDAYTVIISNAFGSITSSVATVTIGLPPSISIQPLGQTAPAGSSIALSVTAAGSDPLNYQWWDTAGPIQDATNAIFTLTSADPTNSDAYTVIISNAFGSITSSVATVTIGLPPSISIQPLGQTAPAGSSIALSVTAAGKGPLNYQWQLNGTNLPNDLINTVAGNGIAAYNGDELTATNASLNIPFGLALDALGNFYIADTGNQRVRKVDTNNVISTAAGNGVWGYSGDGEAATNANFLFPLDVAIGSAGQLLIADQDNHCIRKVDSNGIITTVIGNGRLGNSGDGGAATNASLSFPRGLAVDTAGNIFIADSGSSLIREVDTNGIITTKAGNGTQGYSGDGSAATNASLNEPTGVAVDGSGELFIADSGNNSIRKVDSLGIITTVAGNGLQGYSGDGGAATNSSLNDPTGVAVDTMGNLFIADSHNSLVRMVDSSGIISTFAGDYILNQYNYVGGYSGDGGAATNASLFYPYRVVFDKSGNLLIADLDNNRIRQVSLTTEPAISIHNLNTNEEGDYTVIVGNEFGTITSIVATVTISLPPTIEVQPISQIAPVGASVLLSVTAAGQAPLNYQWWNSLGAIQDATNAIFTLISADPTNSDSYTVTINNTFGSITSSVASVTIGLPPSILLQPTNEIATAGSTVNLSVTASGTVPLSYQWRNNGGAIQAATNSVFTLSSAEPTNSDNYTVTVNNAFGSITSSVASVTIGLPPSILLQPTLQVAPDTSATMSVTATGSAPLTYQWWNSTGPIQDATNAVYTVNASESLDSYTVRISNTFGSITSSVAIVSIDAPPTIAVQPMNQSAPTGAAVTLSVTASGSDPLNYQWWNSSGAIFDATNPFYTLNPAATNESDNYTVTINNAFGSITSSPAIVSIGLPPTIAVQPISQAAAAGALVILNVTATGSATLNYQWSNSGGAIPNATNSAYNLAPATTKESDNYSVTVMNAFGSVTSSVASVNIGLPPAIVIQPASRVAAADTGVALSVTAAGSAPLNYQWWDSNGTIQDATNAIYNLASAAPTNSDNYIVTINNAFGSITSSVVTLTIGLPPSVILQPVNQTAPAGEAVTLSVTASGTEPLNYQWWNSLGAITGATNASLMFSSADPTNSDNYTVIISNDFGSITSSVATVTIGLPPSILVQPTNQTVSAGSAVTLNAMAAGSAPLSYQWWKTAGSIPAATNVVYTLDPATTEESGNYSVTISNLFGSITSSVANVSIAVWDSTSSGNLNAVIPFDDIYGYTNSINVVGAAGQLQNVTVQLNISGGHNGDLYSYLYHDGQMVQLLDNTGTGPDAIDGYGDPGFAITLSDSGTPGLHYYETNNPQFNGDGQLIGNWQPDSDGATLGGTFANQDPNGEWSIFIANLSPDDESTLVSWSLNLTTTPQSAEVLTVSANPAYFGSSVNFTSTVSAQNPADGIPTGIVQFNVDGALLGSPVALDGNGVATLSTSALTAGSHLIIAEYSGDGTFQGITNSYNETINPLNITVTADSQTKVYGTTDPSLTYTFTPPLIAGDGFSGSLSRTTGETVGSYAICQGSLSLSTNYTLTYNGANLSITPAPLSITANSMNKLYGATVTFSGTEFSANGLLNSDIVTSVSLASAGAESSALEGNYPIVPTMAVGSGLANYIIKYLNGALLVQAIAPTVISLTPVSQTNNATTTASFVVTTTSLASFTNYQWLKITDLSTNTLVDGANISGSTTSTLTISNVLGGDQAVYAVSVSNPAGMVVSNASLIVNDPFIFGQPLDTNTVSGSDVTLSVTAAGTAPLTYQWFQNNTFLPGQTASNLVLKAVSASDSGYYQVVVSNSFASITSSVANITIYSPPSISVQPMAQMVVQGSNATFNVVATGTDLHYQWYGYDGNDSNLLGGATNASLTIKTDGEGSQVYDIEVVVTNLMGEVTSSNASLTVLTVLSGPINPYTPGTLGYDLFQSTFTLASSTNRTASYDPNTNLGTNSAVWTWPINLSCVGFASDFYQSILITSNELLTCDHDDGESGQTVTFHDTNGVEWVGLVTNVIHVISDLDISQLSNSAPASIVIPYVLPPDYSLHIAGNSLLGMPAFWMHKNTATIDYAPVAWVGLANLYGGEAANWIQLTHDGYGAYSGTSSTGGDSGSPGFLSLSNSPIVLFGLDLPQDAGGTLVSGPLNWYFLSALGLTNGMNILDISHYPLQSASLPIPDYNYIVPPTNQLANPGTLVTFNTSVCVFNTSPFVYQWQWNGTNLVGATNAMLTFRAGTANVGNYSVVVSNGLGSVTVGASLILTNNQLAQTPAPCQILAPVVTRGQFQFGFNTVSNYIYSVQYEDNLISGSWVVLTNFNGSGSYWQTPLLPLVEQRFYRLVTSSP